MNGEGCEEVPGVIGGATKALSETLSGGVTAHHLDLAIVNERQFVGGIPDTIPLPRRTCILAKICVRNWRCDATRHCMLRRESASCQRTRLRRVSGGQAKWLSAVTLCASR